MCICCDPNKGIAIFSTPKDFERRLLKETHDGGLEYLLKPVKEKIVVATNDLKTNGMISEGTINVTKVTAIDYSFQLAPTPVKNYNRLAKL